MLVQRCNLVWEEHRQEPVPKLLALGFLEGGTCLPAMVALQVLRLLRRSAKFWLHLVKNWRMWPIPVYIGSDFKIEY